MERETELRERLRRSEARLERMQTTVILAVLVAAALFVSTPVWVTVIPAQFHTPVIVVAWVFGLQSLLIALALIRAWLFVDAPVDLEKRKRRVADLIAQLQVLREQHPDLLLQNEVSEALEGERALTESRRNLWLNLFFTVIGAILGFALSYFAAKLGWMR